MGDILQFPVRNKGRIRKTQSANAEGMLAMHQFRTSGPNIEIFNTHRPDGISQPLLLAYWLETIFNTLPRESKEAVKRRALCDAALGDSDERRILGAMVASSIGYHYAN